MEVKLKVLQGKNAGHELAIAGPIFRVGRDDACHLRPKSDAVSRSHCEIVLSETSVVVRDLNSRNGTFVNNERISGELKLAPGDVLRIGPLEFEVVIRHTLGVGKKPKVANIGEAAARAAQSTAPQGDIDEIASWLNEDDADGDTHTGNVSQTVQYFVPDPAPSSTAAPADAGANLPSPALASRQGGAPKAKPADSRQAAADVLSKLIKKR